MTLILLLFLAALSLEGIGTYISVIGLAATFAADPIILTMAVVLDFCKIISVNTLAKSWQNLSKTIRSYLVASTLVLSIITSAGVAGYLSNSFQKAMLPTQGNDIALVNLKSEQERLLARKKEIDTQVSQLPPNQVRSRQRLMNSFKPETDHINTRLIAIEAELPKLQTTKVQAHTEVGAIMYLAEVAGITPGQAVGIIIALIIFVFDPMAIVFLITANTLLRHRNKKKLDAPKPEPVVIEQEDVVDPEIIHEEEDEPPADVQVVEPKPSILDKLEEVEEQPEVLYKVKRLPRVTIDMTQAPSTTLSIVEPEQIDAEVVVEEPEESEPEVIVPEYIPEPVVEEEPEDTTPYPFPLQAPVEERSTERYEEEVRESVENLKQAMERVELIAPFPGMDEPMSEEKIAELDAALAPYETDPEPHFTTDVEVLHIGEPTPMPLEEGMAILQKALDPIREELAAKEEPHLEEVLREILADKEGPLTDEERVRLDRALDRIFAADPQREHSDEPEDDEAEDHQLTIDNVPGAVPDEPEAQYAPSTLDDPNLDAVKGSGVNFVGPVFVNPTVLETYSSNS
jgi:hypothetical protein